MKSELSVQQVMWVRVGALGDLLVSLEALKVTCDRFSHAKIWIVGSKLWLDLVDPIQWPQVNGIILSEDGKSGQLFEHDGEDWVPSKTKKNLTFFARSCQASVNLRIESFRFSWFAWARIPIRIGSSPWPMKWLYTHWFPWLGKEPAIHERDWYTRVASTIKGEEKIKLPYELKKTGLPRLKKFNETKIKSFWKLEKSNYILMNPTSSRREKAWPSEKYRELALSLRSGKYEVLILGAPKETEWLKEVAGEDFRIIQPKTLFDLADLIGGARLLIANTSSSQFMAASMGTPAVVLMGNATPLRWGPVGPKDQTVCAEGDFSNVSDLFERDRAAYASIPVEKVLQRVKDFLL